jgi:hypothetical protein
MSDENLPIEQQLVRDALMFEELVVLDTKIAPTTGNEDWHVRIELQLDQELVARGAFGFIYFMGLLSFHDGRPRGVSGKWFEDDDLFVAADMLRHLEFERGRLHMYIDYLRGRCVKTTVEVSSDGKALVETVNRGHAATRWVERLRGKKFLQAVETLETT